MAIRMFCRYNCVHFGESKNNPSTALLFRLLQADYYMDLAVIFSLHTSLSLIFHYYRYFLGTLLKYASECRN
jgi:hypothetical protein